MKILAVCSGCSAQYDLTGWQTGDSVRCRCGTVVIVPEPREQDARLVRCASCGAVRNTDGASNCDFCGALFSAVDKGWGSMCPACYCRLPNDAQFCVECGLKIDPHKLATADTQLPCPRCTTKLGDRTLDKIRVHECGACAGLWMSAGTFEEICRSQETQAMATRGLGLKRRATKFELTDTEQVKYIPCPTCKNLMNRHNFASVSGVVIDTCKCGVWLDNQELNRIVQFIQSGGLSRARDLEQRDRAHTDRMRKMSAPPPMLMPMSGSSGSSFNRSGTGVMIEVIAEVARLFLR